jgi:hypothetical protein
MALIDQATAAVDPSFRSKVWQAVLAAAINISSEQIVLNQHIKVGTTVTSILVTPGIPSAITVGTLIVIDGEVFAVGTGGAAQGATTIPITSIITTILHVIGAIVSPPTVPNHAFRVAYASRVLNSQNNDILITEWANALASQLLNNASSDAQINTGVASLWDAFAGR